MPKPRVGKGPARSSTDTDRHGLRLAHEPPLDIDPPTLTAELARRLHHIESGEATFLDAEDHLRSLQAKYPRSR